MAHDVIVKDDMAHVMETYMVMWHGDIGVHNDMEPCR